MIENLHEQLATAIGWSRDDPRLDQLLHLLSEWQISNPTVVEARAQLEQNPILAQASSLISFDSATVSGGVSIGDVAGGNIVKLVLQQGIFITLSQPEESIHKRIEEEHLLKAMMTDHSRFLHDRLSSFVGREQELEELRHKITTMLPTGGYLMIAGQAGQGKSSIIAKLVDDYDPEETAYHFIPINPGRDYQVSLLRDLMARLILKHHLNDLYVTSVSRLALRDYFPNVLREVAANGKQEVIFIDGLDQLREDQNGERDLSFLPNNPPEGILLVLGTRPNDTLRPLELLNSHDTYYLPNISQHDFNLMLQLRHVQLEETLVGKFYAAMEQNALYLDLVAQELSLEGAAQPEEIIQQVADNPDNIFSLSIARLKQRSTEWREVLKPLLGVLLVAGEPLAIHLIKNILGLDAERVREGLDRLGGLIAYDGQQRYWLFHLKLYDYLSQDESNPRKEYLFATDEEENWEKKLAEWCVQGGLAKLCEEPLHNSIEQDRRKYALRHYITHLYYAREWQQLFAVLDEGVYGRIKLRYDPSTHLYAQDLDLVRRAAAWKEWTLSEVVQRIPNLWRYTLLRCSLSSQADLYPPVAFRLLVLLKRMPEACELAELLTDPAKKVSALLQIAEQMRVQEVQEEEGEWRVVRARAIQIILAIDDKEEQDKALRELVIAFAQAQQWELAEASTRMIKGRLRRDETSAKLGKALGNAQQWELAETVIGTIEYRRCLAEASLELWKALGQARQQERAEMLIRKVDDEELRALGLVDLGAAFAQAQQWERADAVWTEVEGLTRTMPSSWQEGVKGKLGKAFAQAQQWERADAIISTIYFSETRSLALVELGAAFARAQQWERANAAWTEIEALIRTIDYISAQASVLGQLGAAFAQAQQWERANAAWTEVEALIHTIDYDSPLAKVTIAQMWGQLGRVLAQTQQWHRAEALIAMIDDSEFRISALGDLGVALAEAQQWERAKAVWTGAEARIRKLNDNKERGVALVGLGKTLAGAQQWEQAEAVWTGAESLISAIGDSEERDEVLQELASALVQAQQWERAETAISSIEGDQREMLSELVRALMHAQQWERVEELIRRIGIGVFLIQALGELGVALTQAQQQEHAEAVWTEAETVIQGIKIDALRESASWELAMAFAQAQQWERAERLIHTIMDSTDRARALNQLATTLAQVQQWEKAEAIWTEVESLISTITHLHTRDMILQEIVKSLTQLQKWERAEGLIHMMEGSQERDELIGEMEEALAQAQQWEHAEELIHMIDNIEFRTSVLGELGAALAGVQQWERAEAMWKEVEALIGTIKNIKKRDKALRKLATALAKVQQWERAEGLMRTIDDGKQRDKTMLKIATMLAQAQQWQRAEGLICETTDRFKRRWALNELATALAQAQQWDQAERVALGIQDSDTRAEALNDLAKILYSFGKHERALRLVYQAWSQTDTRDYAIKLLSLAYGLIPLKAEIGKAFFEGFIWVDSFLQSGGPGNNSNLSQAP